MNKSKKIRTLFECGSTLKLLLDPVSVNFKFKTSIFISLFLYKKKTAWISMFKAHGVMFTLSKLSRTPNRLLNQLGVIYLKLLINTRKIINNLKCLFVTLKQLARHVRYCLFSSFIDQIM